MGWTPRIPLTAAEKHVDYPRINEHILERRATVERMAWPTAKRLSYYIVEFHGAPPVGVQRQLERVLTRHLDATALFGYQEARREILSLRAARFAESGSGPGRVATPPVDRPSDHSDSARVTAALTHPDAGLHARHARRGLPGVRNLIALRARHTAELVAAASRKASISRTDILGTAAAAEAARRALHNNVLELVGESLNNGRTAGALSFPDPPTYAMRSEVLDDNTCDACDEYQGEIVPVDSPEYFDVLPPTGCYGGGRCRGVMVYADGTADLSLPEAA